ncbi:Rgp1-domain-containing protein [Polychytrium aggregatum]|uniref:Rgp1-domain-containing protein n=1 Tax=Polychytrium aggregatum TaxID=110093 RepID=UPI0022FE14E5|nr:Rgp1-domain-containing protein [Polychytrium aggregatum]KAI9207315.1 Rgp1-domain-containing protein [Polychytrium aggregatum]
MVILLTVSFPQSAVFFAGERFSCSLTFTNPASPVRPTPAQVPPLPLQATLVSPAQSALNSPRRRLSAIPSYLAHSLPGSRRPSVPTSALVAPGAPDIVLNTPSAEALATDDGSASVVSGSEPLSIKHIPVVDQGSTFGFLTSFTKALFGTGFSSPSPSPSLNAPPSPVDSEPSGSTLPLSDPANDSMNGYDHPETNREEDRTAPGSTAPRPPPTLPHLQIPGKPAASKIADQALGSGHTETDKINLSSVHSITPDSSNPAVPNSANLTSDHSSSLGRASTDSHRTMPMSSHHLHSQSWSAPSTVRPEQIAWAFAQMVGSFSVDPLYIKSSMFESLNHLLMYKPGGGGGAFGGGGSFVNGADAARDKEGKAFPVLSTPPTLLFADLSLGPGESKTFNYEIDLPSTLPPSYRGKVIRVSYKLLVNVQRPGGRTRTQLIQLPFRLFGRFEEDAAKAVYEIMNPIIINNDTAHVSMVEDAEPEKQQRKGVVSMEDDAPERASITRSIMAMCQSSRRVNYEICRNNEHVAQVVLQRNTFRVGEAVTVILDFSDSAVPCFQISIFLETSEQIQSTYALRPKHQSNLLTRKVFAEYHKCVASTKRLSATLAIPVNGASEFQTSAVSLRWSLRIEFVTGTKYQYYDTTSDDPNFVSVHGSSSADVEAFDCMVPIKVIGFKTAKNSKNLHAFEIV